MMIRVEVELDTREWARLKSHAHRQEKWIAERSGVGSPEHQDWANIVAQCESAKTSLLGGTIKGRADSERS